MTSDERRKLYSLLALISNVRCDVAAHMERADGLSLEAIADELEAAFDRLLIAERLILSGLERTGK
jgi:hypothetical protein